MLSLHEHNERDRVADVLARLARGERIALVSDAGTPLVSDPGYVLVRAAIDAGFAVSAIPGPSAVLMALALSGLPTDRFCFEGFLPAKAAARRERIARLADETRTLVLFESPHRLADLLEDLCAVLGEERRAAVARELSKTWETVYRGTVAGLRRMCAEDANFARGEITVVLAGAAVREGEGDLALARRLLPLLAKELPPGKAASIASRVSGVPRRELYDGLPARGATGDE
jgi:16S rRNA (cytidine1402-2'-O)-methyltransferase